MSNSSTPVAIKRLILLLSIPEPYTISHGAAFYAF